MTDPGDELADWARGLPLVDERTGDHVRPEPAPAEPLRLHECRDVDEAEAALRGAQALGLGIRLWNEWAPLDGDDVSALVWRYELYRDPSHVSQLNSRQ